MRVLFGKGFKHSPHVAFGYYFFIGKIMYEYFKFRSGKELFGARSQLNEDLDNRINGFLSRGWKEITDLRQFLTHPIPEVRAEAKKL